MSRFTTVYCGSRASHLINHTCGCSVTFWTHAARCTPTRSPSFQHVRKKRGRLWCRATGSVVKPWCQHLTSGRAVKKGPRDLCVTSEHDCLMKHSYSLSLRYLESEKEWLPSIQHHVEDAWGRNAADLLSKRKRRKKFHPAWCALFLYVNHIKFKCT